MEALSGQQQSQLATCQMTAEVFLAERGAQNDAVIVLWEERVGRIIDAEECIAGFPKIEAVLVN